jgi:hypothetical protein
LSEGGNAQALLANEVTSFNKGLSIELMRSDVSIRKAEGHLTQLLADKTLGWADSASTNWLPFWSSVNQACQFLLVYSSPESAFAKAMKAYQGDQNRVDDVMAKWEASSRTALNFFQKNRSRSLLVNVSAVDEVADALAATCSELMGRNIPTMKQAESDQRLKVIEAKAALLLKNYDQLHELYDELQGAATLPGQDIALSGVSSKRKVGLAIEGINEFLNQQEEFDKLLETSTVLESKTASLETKNASLESSYIELKQALGSSTQNQELSLLQIHQLQEELETKTQDQELSLLQIHQLQEELETNFVELRAKNASLSSSTQDQELSLLQIHQLQEELEHYYIKYEELRASALEAGLATSQYRSLEHATVTSCEITSAYSDNGYEDISLELKKIVLGDGRKFDALQCKLVLKAGMVGLEFRPNSESKANALMNWPAEMADEHGPYVLYLPCPNEDTLAQQQALLTTLSTADRQVIYSVIKVLADCFMTGSLSRLLEIEPLQLKKWRLSALQLADQARNKFLTVNTVTLNEEFRSEGYEHLWLQIEGLQVGQQLFSEFNFKLGAVSNTDKSPNGFADQLLLEFRALPNGCPPFQSWPPEEADKHGPKLLVIMTVKSNKTTIGLPEVVTDDDKDLIVQLVKKIPAMLSQLEKNGIIIERAWADWHEKTTKLTSNNIEFSSGKPSVLQRTKGVLRRVSGPNK